MTTPDPAGLPERRKDDPRVSSLAERVGDLSDGVAGLSGRVEALAGEFANVNELTRKQQDIERSASEAVYRAAEAMSLARDVRTTTMPREDVQERFAHDAELATARLSNLRTQALVAVVLGVVLSTAVLVIALVLVQSANHKTQDASRNACRARVAISQQVVADYDRLLIDPTVARDPAAVEVVQVLRAVSVRSAQVNCG